MDTQVSIDNTMNKTARYKVLVDDNFHYMAENERCEHGVFSTAEEAVASCKRIVDDDLENQFKQGMTADELYEAYVMFGEDPFVVALNPADERIDFSAWQYAKERRQAVTSHGKE
jgi:hypothetical protein